MGDIDAIQLLKKLSQALERLSHEERANLINAAFDLEIKVLPRKKKEATIPVVNIETLLLALQNAATREEGHALLDKSHPNRSSLEQIGRALDIPINKQDKLEVLRDKIVETTVGARLRSLAIKGAGG